MEANKLTVNPGIHALRQEAPIILPDDAGVVDAITKLTSMFPTRDLELERVANDKLSIRFLQLNEAIQSSVSIFISTPVFSHRML